MRWRARSKKKPGWLALSVHADRVDLVHVKRTVTGRPELAFCDTFRKEGSDVDTLTRLRKELKLEQYRCTALLPAAQYQLHQVEAPPVPAAELKSAVRWRLKDIIEYPVETATVEVLEIPGPGEGSGARSIYAVTAKNDDIGRFIRPFDDSQVPLEVIDIAETSQRNVAALFEGDGEGVAMLAFYPEEAMLTFTRGGELYVSRRIEVTLAELADEDPATRNEVLERIALSIQRSLDHFEREFAYVPLGKLLIAPMPHDIGLVDYLASNIEGRVEAADLSEVMDLAAAPELAHAQNQARYLAAIGAALREEALAA